jgi:hypothetical protein
MTGRRCEATRADGAACRAWAVRGSDPPRCAAHGGTTARIGAPPGSQNALKHGFYVRRAREAQPEEVAGEGWSIERIILDLSTKQARLSQYIEARAEELSAEDLARFLMIHGQNASRLGRLLRDRRALSGEAADGISAAIAQALDELNSELGTDPT